MAFLNPQMAAHQSALKPDAVLLMVETGVSAWLMRLSPHKVVQLSRLKSLKKRKERTNENPRAGRFSLAQVFYSKIC